MKIKLAFNRFLLRSATSDMSIPLNSWTTLFLFLFLFVCLFVCFFLFFFFLLETDVISFNQEKEYNKEDYKFRKE